MNIQCDCGEFRAELYNFPKATPGRLVCYCDDCQLYAKKIEREDILDPYGGTQVIPVYPNDVNILSGEQHLKCNLLKEKGLHRWSVTCCNTPVINTIPKFPWAGIPHRLYTNAEPGCLERLGKIKSRIKGKYAIGEPPFKLSQDFGIKDAMVVIPFVARGFILRKFNRSPLFQEDGQTPIKDPMILS